MGMETVQSMQIAVAIERPEDGEMAVVVTVME